MMIPKSCKLTPSQQATIEDFKRFLDGPDQVFMLKGAAGTGKTTIISEFIRFLQEHNRTFALMAPTGRAAFILGKRTNNSASTIHKGIYSLNKIRSTSQDKESEDDGGIHVSFRLRANETPQTMVYIVDEASMVSDIVSDNEAFSFGSGCLLTDLFEFIRGRKVILVGDYAQLPPVGMNFSPALDKDYIENKFDCKVHEVILREIMRQQTESMILQNANRIRSNIEAKTFVEFQLQEGAGAIKEAEDLLAPYFRLSPLKPGVHSAVITFSNKQALEYNLAIRNHYYGQNAPRLKSGDLLMIARNSYTNECELFNGNIVKVEACEPDNEVEIHNVRVKLGKERIESVELRFRKVVLMFNAGGQALSINVKLLDNFLDDTSGSIGGLLARALVVDFEHRLPQFIKDALGEIKRLRRNGDKLDLRQEEIFKEYLYRLMNDPYYNAVIAKYGYAMTCHKAQGGEWQNVFVDMGRFGGTANEDYFRWTYTALTRASDCLWYFRSPDFNYISKLVVEEIKPSLKLSVSTYSSGADFIGDRMERLTELCKSSQISVHEDRSKAFQHILTFTNETTEKAVFQLWYKKKGYNGIENLIQSSSDDFATLCKGLLHDSLVPVYVPFISSKRPFAEKLVTHVKALLVECGIQLLDITQEQYQDVFHLKTDGLAKVGFHYNDHGSYTYMSLISSLGSLDIKLEIFRQRFL